jgi:UDP-N-acetylmuramate dehydrogenase
MLIHKNISLQPYNTFRIDVNALFLTEITSVDDLDEAFTRPEFMALPKIVLGGGSNILFTGNQRKVILKLNIPGIEIVRESGNNVWVRIGAGEIWHQFVLWCIEQNLGGAENLSLIPGTVGAAPMQNIGAYGVEIKDIFSSLEAYEIKSGKTLTFDGQQCKFGYRHSIFKGEFRDRFIITSVTLKLSRKPKFNIDYGTIRDTLDQLGNEKLSIRNISEAVIKIRQSKLPDPTQIGNAGSFFKNPIVEKLLFEALQLIHPELPYYSISDDWIKIPAAWLIAQCGWKGHKTGEVGVHENQPLVLVNLGKAKGKDVVDLSRLIQKSVQQKFGIELNREVNVI